MLMGPGTRSSLQSLFPCELPSLHLPQGRGVPSSSIRLPLLHPGLCPEGLRLLPLLTFALNIRMLLPAGNPPGLPAPPFPTPACCQLSLRSISSAHVDLVWLSLSPVVHPSIKCPVRYSSRIPGELPKSTSLSWELGVYVHTHQDHGSQGPSIIGKSESGQTSRRYMITETCRINRRAGVKGDDRLSYSPGSLKGKDVVTPTLRA